MKSTKDVIDHHLNAFAERDLKGVLSDYAPEAVFFTPQGPLKGVDAIRPLFPKHMSPRRREDCWLAEAGFQSINAFNSGWHYAGPSNICIPRAWYTEILSRKT